MTDWQVRRGVQDAGALVQLGLYSLQHRGQESAGIVAVDETGRRAPCAAWGSCPRGSATASCRRSRGIARDRPHALQHRRLVDHRERAAGARALRAAATSRSRTTATSSTPPSCGASSRSRARSSRRRWIPRSSCIASRARTASDAEERARRRAAAASRARTASSSRSATRCSPRAIRAAGVRSSMGTPRRRARVRVRDLRARHRRRDASSARSSPARSSSSTRDGVRSIVPAAEAASSRRCVFEYVYFARPDSRVFGGSVDRARRALGRRLARECPAPGAELVFSVPDSSNSAALGFAEESGLPLRARAHSQSLRRPHVHPADAGRTRREGEGEVQRRARSARRARAS